MQSSGKPEKDDIKNEIHLSQLASVGQIAAGIAHEVRNPLTAVKGFLQLMKEKNEVKYVDIAQSELDNALVTLENLLHVSKPDLEDEAKQSINMAVEIESVIQLFQDQLYRVELRMDFQDPKATIYGKKNLLKKAFFNLLRNSFEAIPDKGVISIVQTVAGGNAVIKIEDTGRGIPKDKLVLLGTPFFTTKSEGTGMGLTQVFQVIYAHGGSIKVESEENAGTSFEITLPLLRGKSHYEVKKLNLVYKKEHELRDFFLENRKKFEQELLNETINVKDKIEEIQAIGNINLLQNANRLVLYLIESNEPEIISFARDEGVAWARHSLTLSFKLEWIKSIRRVLWDFLYNFDRLSENQPDREGFYALEKQINDLIDLFLNYFLVSFTHYKDDIINSQREMVEDLFVPVIPLSSTISILPLIGTIDTYRADTIVEKVISTIGLSRIEKLIIDLSGVVYMDTGVIGHIFKVIDGAVMMGCNVVITGIRPEIVKIMLKLGVSFDHKAETKGTLQQALSEYLKPGELRGQL